MGGIVMGLLATAILVANNIRDIDTDEIAGKRTLAVILGRRRTEVLYTTTVIGAFAAIAVAALAGWIPTWTLLAMLAIPPAIPIVRAIVRHREGPELIAALKGTARLQLLVGVLFAVGVLV